MLTGVALLPAFAIVATTEVSSRRLREAEAHDYVARMSDLAASELERALTGAATLMIAMAAAPPVSRHAAAECNRYVREVNRDLPQLTDIVVADGSGTIFCRTGELPASDLPEMLEPLLEQLGDGRFAIGGYQSTPAGGSLPIAMRAETDDGEERFVIVGVSVQALEELIYDSGFEPGTRMTIADRDGTVLAHRPLTAGTAGDPLPDRFAALAAEPMRGTAVVEGYDGRELIVAYQPPLESRPFYIALGVPRDDVMAPINEATLRATLLALAGAAMAFLLAWSIGRAFIRSPVQHIVLTMRAWRNGDRTARTDMSRNTGELAEIGAAMNQLFDEIDKREEAQLQAERHRDVLARELEHRVKNILAVVQAIARRTFSGDASLPEARRSFQDRLSVLARSQATLTESQWSVASITETIRASIEPFADPNSGRIRFSGPDVDLDPKPSQALSMALHELFTNASKYGALSVPEGRVDIEWDIRDTEARQEVDLRWKEHGGPPVAPPEGTGFGSLMITQMLKAETGGEVGIKYLPEGLTCDIRIPVSTASSEENAARRAVSP